jgi:hypothetical protein
VKRTGKNQSPAGERTEVHQGESTKVKEAGIRKLRRILLTVLSSGLVVGTVAAQTKIGEPWENRADALGSDDNGSKEGDKK